MSNINPLVRINIDTADDIEKLYGVGRKLAERIVSYRNAHHYFQSPEDLAKVDGISLQLAVTISPHISWELPVEPVKYKDQNWFNALIYFLVVLGGIWIIKNRMLPAVSYSFFDLQIGTPNAWIFLLISIALTIAICSIVLSQVVEIIISLSRNLALAHRLQKIEFFFIIVFIIGALTSGFGHAMNYSLNNTWQSLFTNIPYMLGITAFLSVFFGSFPIMLVAWKPKLVTNLFLSRIYDIGFLLTALVLAWYVWEYYRNQPIWVSFAFGFVGVVIMVAALDSIRIGHSIYFRIASAISLVELQVDDLSAWKKWVNARLPDPEQQKALKKALEEMHPSSRFNTIIYAMIFGVGGWLFLTALSAVIQWFIENMLNKFFR